MKLVDRLPYIVWRDGRPRFSPGPRLRSLGFKGEDLRHSDGRWLSLEEARNFSAELQSKYRAAANAGTAQAVVGRGPARAKPTGFVYFLWSGENVKIGYSATPLRRAETLMSGLALGVRALVIVPGNRSDERRLHHALRASKRNREWFAASADVVETLTRSSVVGHPAVAVRLDRGNTDISCPVRSQDIDFPNAEQNF